MTNTSAASISADVSKPGAGEHLEGLPFPYLLFLADITEPLFAKTGLGLRDWAPEKCIGEFAMPGATVSINLPVLAPAEAKAAGAKALLIGVAPQGGRIMPQWIPYLVDALDAGLDLVNGMHSRLQDEPILLAAARRTGRKLFDVRIPPQNIAIGNGTKRAGMRLLTVGTDCSLGKKYTALTIDRSFRARGIASDFKATGQTGIMIAGSGIPMDAVISDFLAGAAEMLSPEATPDHWDVIEGQGSLTHPAYGAVSFGLLTGSQPDVIVVCHAPNRTHLLNMGNIALPSIEETIDLNLLHGRRANPRIRCAGVALNTAYLSDGDAAKLIYAESMRLGMPVADPIRGGPQWEKLIDACLRVSNAT